MPDTNNSISTTLTKFTKLFNNSLEGYNKFTEAMISNSSEIFVDIIDENNDIKRISIAGYKYILSELERLNYNITQLTGLTEDKVTTVKIDDDFRRVLMSTYKREADDIERLNNITTFSFKTNHFFESLIDPSMYITFDLQDQIDSRTESIYVERYIFKDLDDNQKEWFKNNYLNKNAIDRESFLRDLDATGTPHILDQEVVALPPKEIIYGGNFSVISINDVEVDETVGSKTYKRKKRSYKLDKLTYTDYRYNFRDNLLLKVGDVLVLSDDSTAFRVTNVDPSNNTVVLELRDGYGRIRIGDNVLRYHSDNNVKKSLELNVGFDEYNLIFLKSINSEYKIPSKNWSPGVAYYTNDLLINTNGVNERLEDFYRREVIDFGLYLQSITEDKIIPASLGLKPDPTSLNSSDFQVLQINTQINTNTTIQEIKDLESEKNRLRSEITQLTNAIKNDQTNTNLINEKIAKTDLYNSIVQEIDTKANDISSSEFVPKYRVRGFFPIPDPKVSSETGEQHVIRFLISYRYISTNGSANAVNQIEFNDNGVTRYGVYSGWVETYSTVKPKEYNPITGKLEWIDQKVEDADIININSVDIPIKKNEIVEIRVRSVSEAGYPSNPMMSDWSNTVRINFPTDLDSSNVIGDIVEHNKKDLVRVDLQNELTSIGVYKHVNTSIEKADKYFPHTSLDIASGFLSPEQNIVSLFDKLVEYNQKITLLEETLAKKTPVMNVKLLDSDGNVISINRDQQNKLFAGYYTDYVQDLNVKKGKIITKTYFLVIENLTASDLELISRMPGSITKRVNRSEPLTNYGIEAAVKPYYENYETYDSADIDYLSMRKYDLVPIMLSNPDNPDGEIVSYSPYQSAQVKSQFVYNRFKDIAKEEDFYGYYIPDDNGEPTSGQITSVINAENTYGRTALADLSGFIWGGDFDSNDLPTKAPEYYAQDDNTIEVHINHPFLRTRQTFEYNYEQITGTPSQGNYMDEAAEIFRQSKFMTLKSDSTYGKKQSIFIYDQNTRSSKASFESDDVYLLGKKSCGAYLFMATEFHENIAVDGKSLLSKKVVTNGDENSIKIPILFQFRMTDYYGEEDNGLGNIGGDVNQLITNLTYTKEIGFDIYDSNDNLFSFDLEVTAKYKPDNLNLDLI